MADEAQRMRILFASSLLRHGHAVLSIDGATDMFLEFGRHLIQIKEDFPALLAASGADLYADLSHATEDYFAAVSELSGQVMEANFDFTKSLISEVLGQLGHVHQNLTSVANNFLGADLRDVRLDGSSTVGILWNEETRWPDGWDERIRGSSVEIKPGSGVFIVLPSGESNLAKGAMGGAS
ncbi:hypothetical protein [Nocardiopsis protaetiae]|uniref:hypothetical protein n=1 Tax=Nocardiopsis protaetiae TaxID=3382270 RepID=UPI00387B0C67